MLTAARELQQINNEIQGLENQATMLINQARNLASLPYSSLATLEQSITQTQQLLTQAQRIAYSVSTIDQAFTQTYPQAYSSGTSSQQLLADSQTRWQNARAGFQDAMRVQAGLVQNLDTTRTQIDALVSSSQSATGALQAAQSGNQLVALQTSRASQAELMRGHLLDIPAIRRAAGFSLVAVAIIATTAHFDRGKTAPPEPADPDTRVDQANGAAPVRDHAGSVGPSHP